MYGGYELEDDDQRHNKRHNKTGTLVARQILHYLQVRRPPSRTAVVEECNDRYTSGCHAPLSFSSFQYLYPVPRFCGHIYFTCIYPLQHGEHFFSLLSLSRPTDYYPMFYIPISMPFIGQFLLGPFCNEKTDVLDNYNTYILVFLDSFVSACLVRAPMQTRQVGECCRQRYLFAPRPLFSARFPA